jgi:glyoxylase-like metal-dependent hydrolase (beta-lactamase superfamily II)
MLARIGNVEIWRILESVDPFLTPQEFFPDMEPDGPDVMRRETPRQLCPDTGSMLIPIQGFLLKTPQHVVLVDACIGNDKTFDFHPPWHKRSDGRFLAALAAAGVSPADIDFVMCTHLHVDHVGWNTKLAGGRWVPTFPNARYIFPSADHAHFSANPGTVYKESILPVVAANQAELVCSDHKLGDCISLISTPGHTPGHVSVGIADGGKKAVITGDAIHSPIQCLRPHWNFAHDHDKPLAAQTRRAFLEGASDSGNMMLGSHFPLPSRGIVRNRGEAFEWVET